MNICVLTHPLGNNYGGIMQAYALQKTLISMGHNVVTDKNGYWRFETKPMTKGYIYQLAAHILIYLKIDKIITIPSSNIKAAINNYYHYRIVNKKTYHLNREFINKHINTIEFFNNYRIPSQKKIEQFDAIVVGSDQVWRSIYTSPYIYFLNFVESKTIKRIAYAASFGANDLSEYTTNQKKISEKGARLFNSISVREESGVEICKNSFGVDAEHVLDPTMLLSKDDYCDLLSDECTSEEKYIACYILDESNSSLNLASCISKKLDLPLISFLPSKKESKYFSKNIREYHTPSIYSWLKSFRDAEYIVTDSFHGTVFSIIFNKPFYTKINNSRGGDRFKSLLKTFKLEDRIVDDCTNVEEITCNTLDFSYANKTIEELRSKSLDFLIKSFRN